MELINRATPPLTLNKAQGKRIVLGTLISLTVIQKMPIIRDTFSEEFRIILYFLFGMYVLISLPVLEKHVRKTAIVRLFLLVTVFSFFLNIIALIFKNNSAPFMDLMIPFGILICSLYTSFNKNQLSRLLMWYAILVTLLGVSSIFYYGAGFHITQLNLVPGKNNIGPMLGIAAITLVVSIFDKRQFEIRNNYMLFKIALLISILGSLLAMRNRSGIVAVSLVVLFYLIREYRPKKSLKTIMSTLLMLVVVFFLFRYGAFNNITDMFWKSLTLNHDITDFNSMSAGRLDGYELALDYIVQHPVSGGLVGDVEFNYIPHNYILYNWLNYGIVGSIPLVGFYLYLFYFAFRGIYHKLKNGFTLPMWVLLFSLIVSLAEYTYPYGPGVSQLMLWFLIGQYVKEAHFYDQKGSKTVNSKNASKIT